MNRYVVMVDAGYLLRQSLEIVSRRASKRRADLEIANPAGLIAMLVQKAQQLLALDGKELLRVYWYDGVNPGGLTEQQKSLVEVDDVQFRAGTVNAAKQQKGVDSLIVTDLIELTSHHAMCDAILITGDSDLAIGIELAQRRGVRIAVLGVEDLSLGVAHHQSFEITSRADRVGRIGTQDLIGLVRYLPPQPVPALAAPESTGVPTDAAPIGARVPPIRTRPTIADAQERLHIENVVGEFFAAGRETFGTSTIDAGTSRIEAHTDRALIHHVFAQLAQGALSNEQKVFARDVFRRLLQHDLGVRSPSTPK